MALVDFAERQLTLKLVYYGPPLSGKTSNLRALYTKVDTLNRGRLMTLDTRDDRTLFFDLLPIFFRTSSFSFRIKVYTVPGQPVHEATRRVVLAGTDGVVFVADSSPDQQDANRLAWQNLVANLHAFALDRVPIVVQYNKRDLPDAIPADECDKFGQPSMTLACAKAGEGVLPTFFALVERAWAHLERDLQLGAKLGIDAQTFRKQLAEHVGATEANG
ncbi:MAG: GTPase domain-containing protein [Deltaproteobacteria bacterium]|nr:GTPase domain-containing protein [Deltaproteobacteria bacterium]